MIYSCDVCNYSTKRQFSYIRHLNNKIKCSAKKYECSLCDTNLKSINCIYEHLRNCKIYETLKKELNINNFNNENIEHINFKKIIKYFNNNIFMKLLKNIYFNNNVSENYIFSLKEKNNNKVFIYKKKKNIWKKCNIDNILTLIINRLYEIIYIYIEKNEQIENVYNKLLDKKSEDYKKLREYFLEKMIENYNIIKKKIDCNIIFEKRKKEKYSKIKD